MNAKKAVRYLSVFIIGFFLASLFSFYLIIRPSPITTQTTPGLLGLPSEEIAFSGKDGTRLTGWLIRSEQAPDRVIIFLHGYPASRGDVLFIARDLYPDFSLFVPDLRSFGESGGWYTTLGIQERRDLRSAITILAEQGFKKIGVFGFSLGGAIGIMTAVEDPRIGAIGAYGSFSDLKTLGLDAYCHLWLLKYPLVELLSLYARITFGESIAVVSPLRAAERISIPVLLIHSRDDEQISFAHAERLFSALSRNKKIEMLVLDSGLHGELPSSVSARLRDFFDTALR